jgi:hypothetical protein
MQPPPTNSQLRNYAMSSEEDEIRAGMKSQKAMLNNEDVQEYLADNAKLLRMKYVALLDAGFSDVEALEVIKARGIL